MTVKVIAQTLSIGRDAVDRFGKKHNISFEDGRGAGYRKEQFPCVICGALFHAKRSVYEAGSTTTCSSKCSSEVRSKANPKYAKVAKNCIVCNTEFLVKPVKVKTVKFCSRACQITTHKPMLLHICDRCGCEFTDSVPRKYCSIECTNSTADQPTAKCLQCDRLFKYKLSEERKFCSRICADEAQHFHICEPEKLEKIRKMVASNLSYVDIAKELGYSDDSTISRIVSKYKIHAKYVRNQSRQEIAVKRMLSEILHEDIQDSGMYPGTNFLHDGLCSLGYIEYDGKGGHYRPDQIKRDKEKDLLVLDKPILRLTPQAYHGGIDYLKWLVLKEKSGYCSVGCDQYSVKFAENSADKISAKEILRDCHPLGEVGGKSMFVLKYGEMTIGVAKFGPSTDKNETGLELRRFFVLDGTPKNTESWFLNKCTIVLEAMGHKRLITYCHEWEKGSYLLATGWKEIERKHQEYDFYSWNGRLFSKRTWWKWAKKLDW